MSSIQVTLGRSSVSKASARRQWPKSVPSAFPGPRSGCNLQEHRTLCPPGDWPCHQSENLPYPAVDPQPHDSDAHAHGACCSWCGARGSGGLRSSCADDGRGCGTVSKVLSSHGPPNQRFPSASPARKPCHRKAWLLFDRWGNRGPERWEGLFTVAKLMAEPGRKSGFPSPSS